MATLHRRCIRGQGCVLFTRQLMMNAKQIRDCVAESTTAVFCEVIDDGDARYESTGAERGSKWRQCAMAELCTVCGRVVVEIVLKFTYCECTAEILNGQRWLRRHSMHCNIAMPLAQLQLRAECAHFCRSNIAMAVGRRKRRTISTWAK